MDSVSSWNCKESESPGDIFLGGKTIVPAIRYDPSFDGDEPPGLSMSFASDRSGRVIDKPVATTLDLSTASLSGYATNKTQFWKADHFSDMRVFSENFVRPQNLCS